MKKNGQNERFSAKMGYFGQFFTKMDFLEKIENDITHANYAATLCKKPEQTYEQILRSRTNVKTDESEFVGPNSASCGAKKRYKQARKALKSLKK